MENSLIYDALIYSSLTELCLTHFCFLWTNGLTNGAFMNKRFDNGLIHGAKMNTGKKFDKLVL